MTLEAPCKYTLCFSKSGVLLIGGSVKFIDDTDLATGDYLVTNKKESGPVDDVYQHSYHAQLFQGPESPENISQTTSSRIHSHDYGIIPDFGSPASPLVFEDRSMTLEQADSTTSYSNSQASPISQTTPEPWNLSSIDPITDLEEAYLMERYGVIVGVWMDISDLGQTCRRLVPYLALNSDIIKTCCIACAAKQLALSRPKHSTAVYWMERAQTCYNAALLQLVGLISVGQDAISTEAFFAIVLCSCYEMMDATGPDWQNHLEGISQVGRIKNVNGSSGGFEEAGFWCFARQEVVCCLINGSKPRLDPDSWNVPLDQPCTIGHEDIANRQ